MWIDVDAPLAGVDAQEWPPLDITKPIVLSTGGVSAQATLLAINGNAAATIQASSPGSWGNDTAVRIMRGKRSRRTLRRARRSTAARNSRLHCSPDFRAGRTSWFDKPRSPIRTYLRYRSGWRAER